LFDIGGNGTGLRTGGEEIGLALDLCEDCPLANDVVCDSPSRLWFGSAKKVQVDAEHTVKLLVALEDAGRISRVAGLLLGGGTLVHIACKRVNGTSYDSSRSDLRRMKDVVKVRWAMARGATRLAAATAERCRNMARAIGVERRV
jgi:hypothetical protein